MMARYRASFPQLNGRPFLCHTGLETDLIFNHGFDLLGFASYPLLESEKGRRHLSEYYARMIETARARGTGVILETVTWTAHRDRGAAIGYTPEQLQRRNVEAIDIVLEARERHGDLPTVLSANVSPRGDAYAPAEQMSPQAAEAYHAEQIGWLARTEVDIVSAYTFTYANEAIGFARAAARIGMPCVLSFTTETDGRLPSGMPLREAIEAVDASVSTPPVYFMVNCAHPDHFGDVLDGGPWMQRVRGVVVNASRASHAELNECEELDDGDPAELGRQVAAMHRRHPSITVLGGCCGTDFRHLERILDEVTAA